MLEGDEKKPVVYSMTGEKVLIGEEGFVFWGRLYMDVGEGWSAVERQWNSMERTRKQGAVLQGFFFEFVCVHKQRKAALRWASKLRARIKENLSLEPENAQVGILVVKRRGQAC